MVSQLFWSEINRESILADFGHKKVWFLHSNLDMGKKSLFHRHQKEN